MKSRWTIQSPTFYSVLKNDYDLTVSNNDMLYKKPCVSKHY